MNEREKKPNNTNRLNPAVSTEIKCCVVFFIFLPAPPPGLNCQSNVTIEIEYNKKVAKRFANMARLLSAELLD